MKIVADRYADALADVALAQNSASQVRRELADFLGLMRESPELRVLLENPAVPRASKRGVIEALAERLGASQTSCGIFSGGARPAAHRAAGGNRDGVRAKNSTSGRASRAPT